MSVVDTNVLVYASTPNASNHDLARAALVRLATGGPIAVSRQILREYLAVMTRPQSWSRPLALAEAAAEVSAFARRFHVLEDSPSVWDRLMKLTSETVFGGKQVHDANIVATMLAHGETRLLTFNAADFRRFGHLIEIVEP